MNIHCHNRRSYLIFCLFQHEFYLPYFVHRADGIKIINDDSDLASTYVRILFNGQVGWFAAANFVSQCIVNIKYYPFDSQDCHLMVSKDKNYPTNH